MTITKSGGAEGLLLEAKLSVRDILIVTGVLLTGAGLVSVSMWHFADRLQAIDDRQSEAESRITAVETRTQTLDRDVNWLLQAKGR